MNRDLRYESQIAAVCRLSGRSPSDVAWVCEAASGFSVNIWSLISPFATCVVALGVGIPVYFGVNAIGSRLSAAYGRRHG